MTDIAGLPATSESEEMYLIHVAMAHEEGIIGPVPLRHLSDALGVTTASANEMVRKLETKGLVDYVPYRGVDLTSHGDRVAARVLRGRRLWGVFLADRLGFSPEEADAIACDLEHITTPEVADRLARLLGDPGAGPGGRSIPGRDGPVVDAALSDPASGGRCRVTAVDASPATVAFLEAAGVAPGTYLVVRARTSDGTVLVAVAERELHLDPDTARRIRVRPAPEGP
jgi:DtxR family transcriptional regulator, Mn-dependent transcriptional regulator